MSRNRKFQILVRGLRQGKPLERKDLNLMAKFLSNTPQRSFGWTPNLPDNRDHTYAAPLAKLIAKAPLPAKVDLRSSIARLFITKKEHWLLHCQCYRRCAGV